MHSVCTVSSESVKTPVIVKLQLWQCWERKINKYMTYGTHVLFCALGCFSHFIISSRAESPATVTQENVKQFYSLFPLSIMHLPSEAYLPALISSTSSLQQHFFPLVLQHFHWRMCCEKKRNICAITPPIGENRLCCTVPTWITDWKVSVHTLYLSALNQFSEAVEMWYFNFLDCLDSWYSASVCVHSAFVAQNFH